MAHGENEVTTETIKPTDAVENHEDVTGYLWERWKRTKERRIFYPANGLETFGGATMEVRPSLSLFAKSKVAATR